MAMIEAFTLFPHVFVGMVCLIGLLVGSFLNVVIYRLPIMLTREWEQEARDFLSLPVESESGVFNLSRPLSSCPKCAYRIRPWENIPVLSWLLLRGRCSGCESAISVRYPLVETLTAALSAGVAIHFGPVPACLFALLLVWACIALFMIDLDQMLLPDTIVMPCLWLGLAAGYLGVLTKLDNAFVGAVAGYLGFAAPAWIYGKITGREGMGYGDFKILAVFGAWLGWQMLPPIILLSTVAFAVSSLMVSRRRGEPYPFGPYIIAAGLVTLFFGHELYAWYGHLMGIRIGTKFFE